MDEDWAIDVRKYAPDADGAVIAAIVRYCRIALRNRYSSLVSFSDATETGRVRENYLKKKLALTDPDSVLDAAIARVGERMGGDSTRNRVTVYYLLAEAFGKLGLYGAVEPAPVAPVMAATPPAAPIPPVAPVMPVATPVMAAAVPASAMAAPVAVAGHDRRRASAALTWGQKLPLLLMIIGGLGILYMVSSPRSVPVPAAVVAPVVEPAVVPAAAPVVAIPEGAGIVREQVDEKPMVSVYFATAETDVDAGIVPAAAEIKAYLDSHPGSKLSVAGYADPRGDAAMNAELSKKRAFAVRDALVAAGIPVEAISLDKPADATDDTTSLANGRRVDVRVV